MILIPVCSCLYLSAHVFRRNAKNDVFPSPKIKISMRFRDSASGCHDAGILQTSDHFQTRYIQNHRQKVFNGDLCVCAEGLSTLTKFNKNSTDL